MDPAACVVNGQDATGPVASGSCQFEDSCPGQRSLERCVPRCRPDNCAQAERGVDIIAKLEGSGNNLKLKLGFLPVRRGGWQSLLP